MVGLNLKGIFNHNISMILWFSPAPGVSWAASPNLTAGIQHQDNREATPQSRSYTFLNSISRKHHIQKGIFFPFPIPAFWVPALKQYCMPMIVLKMLLHPRSSCFVQEGEFQTPGDATGCGQTCSHQFSRIFRVSLKMDKLKCKQWMREVQCKKGSANSTGSQQQQSGNPQEVIFLGGMGSMRDAKCCQDKLTWHRVSCGLSCGHTATVHCHFLELE